MKIICGTDFTPSSQGAADVAAALAGRLGQTLKLVHVVDEHGVYSITGGIPEEVNAEARAALDAEVERLRPRGAEIQSEVLHGTPDQKINEEVEKQGDCGLVVVSSLGRRAPERWLLGSVSARLAESASVPTLVLRDATAMSEWLEGKRAFKIMVGFDGSQTSEAALRWVARLAEAGKCEVVAVFVNWPVNERLRLGVQGPLSLTENPAAVQAVLERDLSQQAAQIAGDLPVRIRVIPGFGKAETNIVQIANEENADLVVVGTHQRRGMERFWRGSVSRGVLLRASSSVAVIPMGREDQLDIPSIRIVLVATDFDNTARNTVAYACSIAPAGSTLHLVTVVHPWSMPGPIAHYEPDRATKKDHEQELARHRVALRNLVPSSAAQRGLQVTVEVVEHETPATGIVQAAERINADVVCVGASSGGVIGTLLGSVAQSVVKNSRRPVFVAKPPAQ